MDTTFSQLYKIRSGKIVKQIHQHWGHSNPDNPKQNKSTIIAVFSILMNPQLSALSVEREDIIKEHAQMLWHAHIVNFLLFFIVFLLFIIMVDC